MALEQPGLGVQGALLAWSGVWGHRTQEGTAVGAAQGGPRGTGHKWELLLGQAWHCYWNSVRKGHSPAEPLGKAHNLVSRHWAPQRGLHSKNGSQGSSHCSPKDIDLFVRCVNGKTRNLSSLIFLIKCTFHVTLEMCSSK